MIITIKFIKNLVELKSGGTIIVKGSRERKIVFLRWVFFKLAREFSYDGESTLSMIGNSVDMDHSSVTYGLREFNYSYDTKLFKYSKEIYLSVKEELIKFNEEIIEEIEDISYMSEEIIFEPINKKVLKKLNHKYNIKYQKKYDVDILKYKTKYIESKIEVNLLKDTVKALNNKSSVLSKLEKLSFEDFTEWEQRTELFIKSIKWKKEL
jgi:hypothetical protein